MIRSRRGAFSVLAFAAAAASDLTFAALGDNQPAASRTLPAADLERLRALGYMGGPAEPDPTAGGDERRSARPRS